eukprot:498666-Rhodomonas_salina.6
MSLRRSATAEHGASQSSRSNLVEAELDVCLGGLRCFRHTATDHVRYLEVRVTGLLWKIAAGKTLGCQDLPGCAGEGWKGKKGRYKQQMIPLCNRC